MDPLRNVIFVPCTQQGRKKSKQVVKQSLKAKKNLNDLTLSTTSKMPTKWINSPETLKVHDRCRTIYALLSLRSQKFGLQKGGNKTKVSERSVGKGTSPRSGSNKEGECRRKYEEKEKNRTKWNMSFLRHFLIICSKSHETPQQVQKSLRESLTPMEKF